MPPSAPASGSSTPCCRRFAELPYDRIRLEDVAADAEVTVQTVIRRFGSKHGLLAATVEREFTRLATERAAAMGTARRRRCTPWCGTTRTTAP